jgi:hypothetical protein
LKKALIFEDFHQKFVIFASSGGGEGIVGKGFNLSRKGAVNYREKIGFWFYKGQRTAWMLSLQKEYWFVGTQSIASAASQ